MKYAAVRKYKDGGEAVMEYFRTKKECLAWISKQSQPTDDSWMWMVGEFDVREGE